MARFHKSIEIKAPLEKVFSFVDNPRNGPEVITNLIEVKDVEGTGAGTHYKWTWKMAGMNFQGENTKTGTCPTRIVLNSKGASRAPDLQHQSQGKTRRY